jgi:hypothetical protein
LKSETKKYAINLGTKKKEDVLTELREISISNLGMNYWIFSEAFCKALGQEKKKILGFQGNSFPAFLANPFPLLLVLPPCLSFHYLH